MKLLLTGATGQLGHDCRLVLEEKHEVAAFASQELDIADETAVRVALCKEKPDWIINCAAYTKVDRCETERDLAEQVNAVAPALLADGAAQAGSRLVHISTDYVFAGDRKPPAPYTETDAVGPISWYGKTKLKGEQAALAAHPDNIVLRTAWVYGIHGHNFLKTMLKLALADPAREIRVVDDQHGSLTWSFRLAKQIETLVQDGAARGLYHATADGHATWFEVAETFLTLMRVPHVISPCTTADYPTPARRPQNSILANKRLAREQRSVMRPWQEDLEKFVGTFRDRLLAECRP